MWVQCCLELRVLAVFSWTKWIKWLNADADRELTKESAFALQYTCTCDNGDEYSLAVSLSFILVYWYSSIKYEIILLFWPYILITDQFKSELKPVEP